MKGDANEVLFKRERERKTYKYIFALHIYNFDPYEILQNVKLAWNAR